MGLDLLDSAWPTIERDGITLIGLSVTNLDDSGAVQMSLPFDDGAALDIALDRVVDRFGVHSIGRAASVGRDHGFDAPMLPD